MIYLFIHQNFPAQYRHLVRYLADQGHSVYFITQQNENHMAGIQKLVYRPDLPTKLGCHPYVVELDLAVRVGIAVAKLCRQLKDNGVVPDIMIGHNGWGETLFVKDVFPTVPLLAYFEFFYHATGVDVGFDPEFPSGFEDPIRLRVRNAVNQMGFGAADWGHSATEWQRSLYPADMRPRITAIHEGVDVETIRPDPDAWIQLGRDDLVLRRSDEVITYVARNLEPYRGFHCFMRALPEIQRRRPNAHVVIVGGDKVSYGTPAPEGMTYRQLMLDELAGRLDLSRIHFLGQIPHAQYRNVLQVSSVHVYLTYPFVLSWSFIEAMAAGCLVIGSSTPSVMEVLRDGENGLAVGFFDREALVERIDEVFRHPDQMAALRQAARETAVQDYDLRKLLPRWLRLVDRIIAGDRPALESLAAE